MTNTITTLRTLADAVYGENKYGIKTVYAHELDRSINPATSRKLYSLTGESYKPIKDVCDLLRKALKMQAKEIPAPGVLGKGDTQMSNTEIKTSLRRYLDHIYTDYTAWMNRGKFGKIETKERMIADFVESLSFKMGSKYVKVVQKGAVHSFIVNTQDDPKFAFGDILKAASYSAPARNFARGNIFDETYSASWTGA